MLLNYDSFNHATTHQTPFEWAELHNAIDATWLERLYSTLPWSSFTETAYDGEKSYKMRVLKLFSSDLSQQHKIADSAWQSLLDELTGERYRKALESLCKVDLHSARLEINAWIYDPGCFLAPHTDKENKLLKHLFYLVQRWESTWGGRLLLLRSGDIDDCAHALAPRMENSVILKRSATSWHAVESVSAQAQFPRCSVQVVFQK